VNNILGIKFCLAVEPTSEGSVRCDNFFIIGNDDGDDDHTSLENDCVRFHTGVRQQGDNEIIRWTTSTERSSKTLSELVRLAQNGVPYEGFIDAIAT